MFDIQEELKKLPQKPGVYLMKDADGHVIYVGKAINLKNRVRQYFQSSRNQTIKTQSMVPNIKEFEYAYRIDGRYDPEAGWLFSRLQNRLDVICYTY